MSLPAECVCSIEIRYGKIEEIPGRVPNTVNLPVSAHFTFCQLHEAAPKLYAALLALWRKVAEYQAIGYEGSELLEIMSDAREVLDSLNEQMVSRPTDEREDTKPNLEGRKQHEASR